MSPDTPRKHRVAVIIESARAGMNFRWRANLDDTGLPPRQDPPVPVAAPRWRASARLRVNPAAPGPIHGRLRPVTRNDLPAAGPARGRGPRHPRRGERPEG